MTSPSVSDLLAELGHRAPWGKAAGWDPVGLQIGDPDADASRVTVCHEVNETVVDLVCAEPPGLLLTYHPLIFRPISSLRAGRSPEGRALRLARAGVALAVVHTNFDAAPGGTADALAESLGLLDLRPFGPVEREDSVKIVTFVPAQAVDEVADRLTAAGAGTIGNYTACSFRSEGVGTFRAGMGASPAVGTSAGLSREAEVRLEIAAPRALEESVVEALVQAHPYEEPAYDVYDRRGERGMIGRLGILADATLGDLARTVGEVLASPVVRRSGETDRSIRTVAVVPGAGSELLGAAAANGADAAVTGDISHHRAVQALDVGLAVIDPGHAATERPGVRRLYAAVSEVAPVAIDLTDVDPSPWEAGT